VTSRRHVAPQRKYCVLCVDLRFAQFNHKPAQGFVVDLRLI
jgi:hypothetical protein